MAYSRRRIFKLGGAMLVAASTPTAFGGSSRGLTLSESTTDLYSKQTFQPLLNSSFKVESKDAWLTLVSVDAPASGPNPLQPRSAAVSAQVDTVLLQFAASGDTLQQGTYELSHAELGHFQLFLVPSGSFRYAATLSQLVGGDPGVVPPVGRRRSDTSSEPK